MRFSISFKLLVLSVFMLVLSPLAKAGFAPSQKMGDPPIIGRWDITIDKSGRQVPSWLEVVHSGTNTLVGRFVGEGGSAPSRFKHVIRQGKQLRRLTPIELERANMFPDNHTLGVKDSKRAFLMGNALVVGLVEKAGKAMEMLLAKK